MKNERENVEQMKQITDGVFLPFLEYVLLHLSIFYSVPFVLLERSALTNCFCVQQV